MAERVQRFLWDNWVLESTTVISATSTQAGFPVSWLRDALRRKAWRSPVGWTVVAGFNNKIDFTEAGVSRVGTLTAGTYATGALMATAVQNAMNAAPGATNTYTVTYDSGTNKFTIARATGTDALVLKFGAGAANFASSVHPDLAYTSSDKTGLTSYVSQSGAYQSRKAILLDLGSPLFVRASAIIHAAEPGFFSSVVQGSGSTFVGVGGLATPTFEMTPVGAENGSLSIVFYENGATHQYWRLLINHVEHSLGYVEVGVWFLGDYWQPDRAYVQGNTRQAEMLTDTLRGDQGAIYRNPKNAPKRHGVQYRRLTPTDRGSYQQMEDGSLGQHLFFVTDALNTPESNTVYGVLEDTAQIVQTIGDGDPPDRYDLGFSFLEELE